VFEHERIDKSERKRRSECLIPRSRKGFFGRRLFAAALHLPTFAIGEGSKQPIPLASVVQHPHLVPDDLTSYSAAY